MLQRRHKFPISRPSLVLLQQDEKQWCGVGRAVVGGMGTLFESRHLTEAQLVENLAGFLITEGIVHATLEESQET